MQTSHICRLEIEPLRVAPFVPFTEWLFSNLQIKCATPNCHDIYVATIKITCNGQIPSCTEQEMVMTRLPLHCVIQLCVVEEPRIADG